VAKTGELALGIIFVLVGLPLLVIYLIGSTFPYVGPVFGYSFTNVGIIGGIILVLGIVLLADSQSKPAPFTQTYPMYETEHATSPALSRLDQRILVLLSNQMQPDEISNTTGVSRAIIEGKIALLYENGYITDGRKLTEKGFEEIPTENPPSVGVTSAQIEQLAAALKPEAVPEPEPQVSVPSVIEEESPATKKTRGASVLWTVPITFLFVTTFFSFRYSVGHTSTLGLSFTEVFLILTVVTSLIVTAWEVIRRVA
jgi:hypothetical protein